MFVELIEGGFILASDIAFFAFAVEVNFLMNFSEHLRQSHVVEFDICAGPTSNTTQEQEENQRAV